MGTRNRPKNLLQMHTYVERRVEDIKEFDEFAKRRTINKDKSDV